MLDYRGDKSTHMLADTLLPVPPSNAHQSARPTVPAWYPLYYK